MLTVLRYTLADILNENISDSGAVSTTGQCFSLSLISYGIKAEWAFHMRSFPTSNECDFKCVLANLRGNEAGVYTANKPSTSKMLPHMSFHSRARPHPHLHPRHRCELLHFPSQCAEGTSVQYKLHMQGEVWKR